MLNVSTLKPLDDRVVIEPLEPERETPGGIVLPESVSNRKNERGTVVAVGPGKLLDNGERGGMDIQVGDKVVYARYAGTEVEDYVIVRAYDVLAVID